MAIKHRVWASAGWLARWVLGAVTIASIALWVWSVFGYAMLGWRGRMAASLTMGEVRFEGEQLSLEAKDGWANPKSQATFTLQTGWLKGMALGSRIRSTPWIPHWRSVRAYAGQWNAPMSWQIELPLWLPIVICGLPAGRAWVVWTRRKLANRCLHCGYSMAGLGSGAVCPECGRVHAGRSTRATPAAARVGP
jgi:hypothetical protein